MIQNIENYKIQQDNNQFFLQLNWKNNDSTRTCIDLDQIYHFLEDIQNDKNIEQQQIQLIDELKSYVNQQQETQLSERDSKDNIQDYLALEEHLQKIFKSIFEFNFLQNSDKLAQFLGLKNSAEINNNSSINKDTLNQYTYENTQQTIQKIENLNKKMQDYYKYIVLKKSGFWGSSGVPLIIEKTYYLHILKPEEHKSYKIPINNNNLSIKYLGETKQKQYGIEIAFMKKGKQQKLQLVHSEEKKLKNWFDNLQQSLFENNNNSDSEILEMQQKFQKQITEPNNQIMNKEINQIFKKEVKYVEQDIQIQNSINLENQLALNVFKYLQNQDITKEQIQQVEKLIVENKQHILNCIQNYHNMEIGIKSVKEQITIYEQDQEQLNEEANEKNQKKNKKQQPKLWFNNDYTPVDKHKGQNNGMHFINKEFLKVQDSIYTKMIKRFGKVLFSGQPIFSISMPAVMFQGESMLERTAYTFGNNYYLNYAANATETIESIKFMTCFYQASFVIALAQHLPLNPILGETFQGRINGDPIYFEQICHHPPVSYYQMKGQNYNIYSPHQPQASLSLTQVEGRQAGHPTLELKNGKKIYYMWFPIRVKGLVMGDRVVQAAGRSFCFEPNSRILCELNYDQNVSKNKFYNNIQNSYDVISGGIYKVTQQCMDKFIQSHKFPSSHNGHNLSINLETDVEEILSKAEGDYKEYLSFDGIKYWDGNNQRPFIIQMENYALPSDSRYRLDSLALRQKEIQKADQNKDELENLQRKDKKQRAKLSKKKN